MSTTKNILVLGSASWLGSIFLSKLDDKKYSTTATYFNTYLNFDVSINLVEAKLLSDYETFLSSIKPNIIVNFLRNDNQKEVKIHQEIIDYCKKHKNSHYIFCSSALALDGHKNKPLTENVLANSISEYGIFKATCERMLYDSNIDWTILRFSSLQGFCKHKIIRNEYLLKQLKNGETIKVDQKVFQNRMFADDAVDIILKIIELKQTGIIHLGTTDASDEIDFLRKQADHFGYNPKRFTSKKYIRDVNLNCIPHKIHSIDEKSKYFDEADTLNKIFNIEAYKKYKSKSGD